MGYKTEYYSHEEVSWVGVGRLQKQIDSRPWRPILVYFRRMRRSLRPKFSFTKGVYIRNVARVNKTKWDNAVVIRGGGTLAQRELASLSVRLIKHGSRFRHITGLSPDLYGYMEGERIYV